ncbi:ferredoxin [Marinitoga sp. 1135]|uniref:4Fe-4S protein n=1 Tax=Marinitoga piezophila (strain DSM 14283 / JCM 11233 / KA3) TaxID=443254 RepID=H2J5E1_MARPK|nr:MULTISPECIES: 4Fe-4S binding protein [Marinitoga]AEX86085.1 4Fe-4S protein [Marinitoga piezophila KA3]APT76504.1 ferredoxin [Marinitoga sp. 1137]NUU96271.1 ferredoxin [Marinitoga sp. 1135]NUU98190.1 ferredoxin [Marinitoga sp. 1138]
MAKKSYEITINYSYCKNCGICYHVCPTKALGSAEMGKPIIVDESKCIGCLMCERLCPDIAIDISEKKVVEANG